MWYVPPPGLGFAAGMILLIFFGLVVVIDMEHRLILHPVSLAGAVLALGIGIWQRGLAVTFGGGVAGFAAMLALFILGNLFARGISLLRRRTLDEEALGFGDVTLSGVLGLLLGWPGILIGLFLAIIFGGLVSLLYLLVMLLARRYRPFTAIPYGPFLIASAVLLIFFRGFLLSVLGQ